MPRLILPVLAATGLCWWLDGPEASGIAAGAGLLLLGVIYLITQMRLSSSRNAILDKLEESSVTLREMLARQVTEDVTAAFGKFLEMLDPAHASATEMEEVQGRHLERLKHLRQSFHSLQQQIDSLTPAGKTV